MTADIHTCSYYCERPECVRRQRDELRDRLEAVLAQQPAAVGVTKRELFTIAAIHTLRAGDYAKWEHLAQDAVSLADAVLSALAAQQQGGAK